MNQQKQIHLQQEQQSKQQQQQQMLQQQQQQQQLKSKRRTNNNNNTVIKNRKRSHSSSSSTDSFGSPSTNLFSTPSSSDSGSSLMTSIKHNNNTTPSTNLKKKKMTKSNSDSSSTESGGNTTPPDIPPSSSSVLLTSSNSIPQRLTAQRSVPAFLNKLYNMVEDLSTNDLVRWSKDGTSFIVEKHEEFAKTVLPRFYKHNTFASFVRQLNMYDFHKVPHLQQGVLIAESEHEIWEFSNPHFQRGRPDLLVLVTRKRNRDRDAVDNENVSLQSLVQDLATIKKYQTTIGTDLRSLHHDNEILWQETLNSREKYQRHQEAIEKILQFLTAIFANDHLAISMNNADSLPKGLIEEAVSLAGMSNKLDDTAMNNMKTSSSNSASASSLTNILSSVLKLYSANPATNNDVPPPSKLLSRKSYKNDRNESIASSIDSLPYPSSPKNMIMDEDGAPSTLIDFSKTLNTATRSAQNITQDIDVLQMNIESLANNLGIDPGQFDDDLETDRCFQDNYSNMMNSTNTADRAKLYAIADSNADLDKKKFTSVYDTTKKDEPLNYHQYNFNLQPPLQQFQPQTRPTIRKHYNNNNNNTTTNNNNSNDLPQPPKPQPIQPLSSNSDNSNTSSSSSSNSTYSQLLNMNYSDSFGPNYPSSGNETPIVNNNTNGSSSSSDYHASSSSFDTPTTRNLNNYYNGTNNSTTNDSILSPGTSEYNTMVNDYADMMGPHYFNTNNGNDNYNAT